MIELPLVSIVIPAFNPRYFAMALQSAVLQTQQRLEVVVSDDSEGDEIEAMVERATMLAAGGMFPIDSTGRRYPWPVV